MKMKILALGLFYFAVAMAPASMARAVKIDQRVQAFLKTKQIQSEQTLPVLVIYRPPFETTKWHPQTMTRAEIETELMSRTQEQEKRFLGGSNRAKVTLWIVNGTLTRLSQFQLQNLVNQSEVESISYSQRPVKLIAGADAYEISAALKFTYGLEKINIPQLRTTYPQLDGQGVRVGIIDTGINPGHKDLKGRTVLFKDYIRPSNLQARDDHGHGTHVAGTIAGGNASGISIGVAPKADLIIAKAFDAQGSSDDSQLLLALQWMADPDGHPETEDQVRIISNSWNVEGKFSNKNPSDEPFCVATDNLARLGILTVFAAGNDGPDEQTVGVPGACPSPVTVGATDEENQLAGFSSRGPAKWKAVTLNKPEVLAPGVDILSADPGGDYRHRSGTSMATPHAAGALALMVQAKPQLSVGELKKNLIEGVNKFGVIDVLHSVGTEP